MNSGTSGSTPVALAGMGQTMGSPFTMSQWQELEHQALIYKYLIAGLPVPPDLVLPIQKNFETMFSRFLHYPSLGYCSLYGKKVDPEPGRCKRTDGKKWRCSKEAYPDSKYCERHMRRGRNRSRKPVESHSSFSSSVTIGDSSTGVGAVRSYQVQNLPFNDFGSGSSCSEFQLDSIPYAIPNKDHAGHLQGLDPKAGENSLFSRCSSGNRALPSDSTEDRRWPMLSSGVYSYPQLKLADKFRMQDDYSQHTLLDDEFSISYPVKRGAQSLHPFLEEWPNSKDSSGLEDETANQTSFSRTDLAISIPMVLSKFSTSSRSPQDH